MGWRPSDRNAVVAWALSRTHRRAIGASDLAFIIEQDDDLRRWWYDTATPGQKHKPIKLSSQNVEKRLESLARRWVVVREDGKHPEYGWMQAQYRLIRKDEAEAIRLRLQSLLSVPVILERRATATAEQLGINVDYSVKTGEAGEQFACVLLTSKRGQTEHRTHLTWDVRVADAIDPTWLASQWRELLEQAGLLEMKAS